MTEFSALAPEELQGIKADLMKRYAAICDRKLSLDITRGKPSPEQLDLSNGLLENVSAEEFRSPEVAPIAGITAAWMGCRRPGSCLPITWA